MFLLKLLVLFSLAVSSKSGVKQSAVDNAKQNVKENTLAIPSWTSEVLLEDTVYTITMPIRYTTTEQLKTQNFKKEFFYLDFMYKALGDPIIKQSKSSNPPFSIDSCIGSYLSDGVRKHKQNTKFIPPSLQMAAITCFAKETLDKTGYILEHGADLAAKEKLILNKDLGQFFVPYMKGINLTREEKTSERPPDCLNDPNHPNLSHCFNYKCEPDELMNSSDAAYDDVCGKFCPTGQAFLYGDLVALNSLNFSRNEGSSQHSYGALGKTAFEIKIMLESKNSGYKNYCFECPQGSRPNEYANSCIDENGCKVLTEKYFPAEKTCDSKFRTKSVNFCTNICESMIGVIDRDLDLLTRDSFNIYYADVGISKENIPTAKVSAFIDEFTVRASQLQEVFRSKKATCEEASTECTGYNSLLMELALKYNSMSCSQGQGRIDSRDDCVPIGCVACKQSELVLEGRYLDGEFDDLLEIRTSCGQWIANSVLAEIKSAYNQRLDVGYLKCVAGKRFDCNLPEITANDIQNYAIRAGFDCAKKTQSITTSGGSR